MKRSTVLAVVLSLLLCTASLASIADCIDATCRITATDNGRGTGCVFDINAQNVYVLTNAHVATTPTVSCEFWRDGHRSKMLTGRVIARNLDRDAAVVVVPRASFGGVLPKAIPFGSYGARLQHMQAIVSVGCPKGAWATAWKGHVLGYRQGDLLFTPTPANGRSGSAIFDAEGTQIVGLLRARHVPQAGTSGGSYGIATSWSSLVALFGYDAQRLSEHAVRDLPAQCKPGQPCPQQQGAARPYVLPYRRGEQGQSPYLPYRRQQAERTPPQTPGPQGGTWPTLPVLPPPTTPVIPPPVDLAPVTDRLDRITDMLTDMQQRSTLPEVVPPPMATPPAEAIDQSARDQADVATQRVGELGQVVQGVVGQVRQLEGNAGQTHARVATVGQAVDAMAGGQKKLGEAVEVLEAKDGSIKDRIMARIKEARESGADGVKGIATAVVWDIVKVYVFGPVGLIGLAVFLVYRRISTGESAVRRLRGHVKRVRESIGDRFADDDLDEDEEDIPPARRRKASTRAAKPKA